MHDLRRALAALLEQHKPICGQVSFVAAYDGLAMRDDAVRDCRRFRSVPAGPSLLKVVLPTSARRKERKSLAAYS